MRTAWLAWLAIVACSAFACAHERVAEEAPDAATQLWESCIHYCLHTTHREEPARVEVRNFDATCFCRRVPGKT